jgi:hypothetical protein
VGFPVFACPRRDVCQQVRVGQQLCEPVGDGSRVGFDDEPLERDAIEVVLVDRTGERNRTSHSLFESTAPRIRERDDSSMRDLILPAVTS